MTGMNFVERLLHRSITEPKKCGICGNNIERGHEFTASGTTERFCSEEHAAEGFSNSAW